MATPPCACLDASKPSRDVFSRVFETFHPLRDMLLKLLPTKDLLSLTSTSKVFYTAKGDVFDINAKLRQFNLDPVAFRTALGRSNALISGAFALDFFSRRKIPEPEDDYLTIYAREGADLSMLEDFLIGEQGFNGERSYSTIPRKGDAIHLLVSLNFILTCCQTQPDDKIFASRRIWSCEWSFAYSPLEYCISSDILSCYQPMPVRQNFTYNVLS